MSLDCSSSLAGLVVVVAAIFGINALKIKDGVITFEITGGLHLSEDELEQIVAKIKSLFGVKSDLCRQAFVEETPNNLLSVV